METKTPQIYDKIREQFDTGPYPRIPIETSPKEQIINLYYHNLVTAYYRRNKQVISTQGRIILDAGCGSGFTTLTLAEANPGAKIVGIDLSSKSLELAQKRLEYHGFDNVEFHVLSLEDLPKLEIKFDYINCDEVLYLLPDPVAGLKAMKAVLKPAGIIRANLHSSLQRVFYFRAQLIFKMMGLMDENPGEIEVDIVREIFKSLKDGVQLKQKTWNSEKENDDQYFMMNYLFQGDKGYTIPEMFAAIADANLEFISMTQLKQWDLMSLFKDPKDIPTFLAYSLPEISIEDKLNLFELFNPKNRLLDFWCGNKEENQTIKPPQEWTIDDWKKVKIHLHPQMKASVVVEELFECINQYLYFPIDKHLPLTQEQILIKNNVAACLYPPLLESPKPIDFLAKRWQRLYPENPITGEATTEEQAFKIIRDLAIGREAFGEILLEL
ncbi:MAG: methyltransferase domain-containing protein [Prochloraceae cyanobacterium]|nr:methyltransferase domain-containing protein [Prochloraceae cyanobacterium]